MKSITIASDHPKKPSLRINQW